MEIGTATKLRKLRKTPNSLCLCKNTLLAAAFLIEKALRECPLCQKRPFSQRPLCAKKSEARAQMRSHQR